MIFLSFSTDTQLKKGTNNLFWMFYLIKGYFLFHSSNMFQSSNGATKDWETCGMLRKNTCQHSTGKQLKGGIDDTFM